MGAFLPFSYLNVCGFWNYFFFLFATVVAAIVVAIFVVAAHFGLTFKV